MSFISDKALNHLTTIPSQTLNLYKLLGENTNAHEHTVKSFQISEFVTFKEYKEYLNAIREDSSAAFYLCQLPDTNITTHDAYMKYVRSDEYDAYPVLGITWEAAMNFCKWKTLKDNKDSITFIYRLPACSEWLAAYHYYSKNNIKNDMNDKYADWLLNEMTEGFIGFKCEFSLDFIIYLHKKNDALVNKRKRVIGDSYMSQYDPLQSTLFGKKEYPVFTSYYIATEGKRHIAFRYVKEKVNNSEPGIPYNNISNDVLKYWGFKTK